MQGGILALFGVSLAGAMGEMLLPSAASAGTRRALRCLLSLVVLLLILTPFLHFLQESGDFLQGELSVEEGEIGDYEQIFSKAVAEQSTKDLQAGLHALLEKEYGISEKNCTVLPFFEADGSVRRISIFLSGTAILQDPQALEEELSARLNCTVEVR